MLIKMRESPRDITHNLLEDVTVKGFCPLYQNRSPFGALNNYKNLKLLNILHYALAPNQTRVEFEETLFDLRIQIENRLLLNWVAIHEEVWHKLWSYIQTLDYPNILLEIDRTPSLIWSLQQDDYENILHYSVKEDNIGLTSLICNHPRLSTCIQFNQTDRMENTAMHIAARSVKIPHILHLVKVPAVDLFQINREGCTILHLLLISIEMQRSNRISLLSKDFYLAINTILSRVPAIATTVDNFDRSPIDIALSIGDSVLLQLLLTASKKGGFLDSSIYFRAAICTNSAPIVSILAKTFSSDFTITKLHNFEKKFSDIITVAVIQQKLKSLHKLLSMRDFAAHINIRNSFGITPLQASLQLKCDLSMPILSCLLYYGSNVCQVLTALPDDTNNHNLDNVFSFTAYFGMSMALRLLIDHIPKKYIITLPFSILASSQNEPSYYFGSNQFYSNPLVAVSQSGDITCLHLLLQMQIFHTIINFQDKSTFTPLSAACASGHVDIVNLLLEAGANKWALIDNRNLVTNDKKVQQSLEHIRQHTKKLQILENDMNEFCHQQRISEEDISNSANRIHKIRSMTIALSEDALQHLSSISREDMNNFAKDVTSFALIHRNFFNLLMEILQDLYQLFGDSSKSKMNQLAKINMNNNKEEINWNKMLERPSILFEDLIDILKNISEIKNAENRAEIESTSMEDLQKKFSNIISIEERIVSGKIGKKIFPSIYLWSRCILTILEQHQEMDEDSTYYIGSKYLVLQCIKSNLESELSSVLLLPSYTTCYNYIAQPRNSYPGFKYKESRSCEVYQALTQSQSPDPLYTPWPLLLNDASLNNCLATTTSYKSSEKSLLKDIASLSDWPLLSLVIQNSDILDWESDSNIMEVVELVAREGSLSILLDLIRRGVIFNNNSTILTAALYRIDPDIFMTLILAGSNFEVDNNKESKNGSSWAKYLKDNQTRKIFHNLQFSKLGATATSGIFSPHHSNRPLIYQWKTEEKFSLNNRSLLFSEFLLILKESNSMEQIQRHLLPSTRSAKIAFDGEEDRNPLYTTVRKITFNNCDFLAIPSFTIDKNDNHDSSNRWKYFLLCQTFNSIYSNLILCAEICSTQKPLEVGEKNHMCHDNNDHVIVLGVLGVHGEVLQNSVIKTMLSVDVKRELGNGKNAVDAATMRAELGNALEVPSILLMEYFLQLPPPPCTATLFLPLSTTFLTTVASTGSAATISSILPVLQAMGSCCGNVLCTDSQDMAMVSASYGNLDVLHVILDAVSSCTRPSTCTTCCCRLSCASQPSWKQPSTRLTKYKIRANLDVGIEEVNVNVFLKKIIVDNERRLRTSERRLQAYNKIQFHASNIFESLLALMKATCDIIDVGSSLEVPRPSHVEDTSSTTRFPTTELREGRLYQLLQLCNIKLTSSFFDFSILLLNNPLRACEELLDKLEISNINSSSSSSSSSDAALLFNYPLQVNISHLPPTQTTTTTTTTTSNTFTTKSKNFNFLSSHNSHHTKSSTLLPPLHLDKLSRIPDIWWRWLSSWEHLLCINERENLKLLLKSLEDHSLKKIRCSDKDVHSNRNSTPNKWLYSVESDIVETFQQRRIRSTLVSLSSLIKSNLTAFESNNHSPGTMDNIPSHYPTTGWVSSCTLPLLCLDGIVVREVLESHNSKVSDENRLSSHLCQVYKIIRDSFSQTAAPPTSRSLHQSADWSMISSYSYIANLTTLLGCHSSLTHCAISGEILELLHVILQEVDELLTTSTTIGAATSSGRLEKYQMVDAVRLQTCKHLYVVAKAWCNIQSFRISSNPPARQEPLLMKWNDLFSRGVYRLAPDTFSAHGCHGKSGEWMTLLLLQAAKSGSEGTFQFALQWITERSVVSSRMLHPAAIIAAAQGQLAVWRLIQDTGKLDINDSNDGWSCLHAVLTGCVNVGEAWQLLNNDIGLPGQGQEVLIGSKIWNVGGLSSASSVKSETNSHRLRITEDILSNPGFDCLLHTSIGMVHLSSTSQVTSFPFPISLLDLASIRGYWKVVIHFIRHGILLGMSEVNQCFALHRAMLEGRIEVLEILQEYLLQTQRCREENPIAYLNALGTTRRLLLSRRTFRHNFPIANANTSAATFNKDTQTEESLRNATIKIIGNSDDNTDATTSSTTTTTSTTMTHSLLHDALYHNNEIYACRLLRYTILVLSEFAKDHNGVVNYMSILRGYHDIGLVYYATYYNMYEFIIEFKKYKDITSTIIIPQSLPLLRLSTVPKTAIEISCMRKNYAVFQIFFEIYMKINLVPVTPDFLPVINSLTDHDPKSSPPSVIIMDMQIKQLFVLAIENQSDEIASHLLSVLLILEEPSKKHTDIDIDNINHNNHNLAGYGIVNWLRQCSIYNKPLLHYCSQSGLKCTLQKLLRIESLILVGDHQSYLSELFGMATALGQTETSKVLLTFLMRGIPDFNTDTEVKDTLTPFPIAIKLMEIPVSTFWRLVEFLWLRGKENLSRNRRYLRTISTLPASIIQETNNIPHSMLKESVVILPTINENLNRPENHKVILPIENNHKILEEQVNLSDLHSISMTSTNTNNDDDSDYRSSISSYSTGTFPSTTVSSEPLSMTSEPYSLLKEYELLLSTSQTSPRIPIVSECTISPPAMTKISRMVIIKSGGGKRRVLRTTS